MNPVIAQLILENNISIFRHFTARLHNFYSNYKKKKLNLKFPIQIIFLANSTEILRLISGFRNPWKSRSDVQNFTLRSLSILCCNSSKRTPRIQFKLRRTDSTMGEMLKMRFQWTLNCDRSFASGFTNIIW